MTADVISHFYFWHRIPEELFENIMAEFAWHGVRFLTFTDKQCFRLVEDEDYVRRFAKIARNAGISIHDVHAPCGKEYDLDIPDEEIHSLLVKRHIRCMELLSDAGARTYTVHVGAYPYVRNDALRSELPVLRKYALRTLEELLPCAEKTGIVICVENSFEPPNSPDEVLYYLNHFNTPGIRCCFDAGHANYMAGKGKKEELFTDYHKIASWRGRIVFEDSALEKLSPYIVTAHLHDNDGYSDAHGLPGTGTIDWARLLDALSGCKGLLSVQNETDAFVHKVPIASECSVFAGFFSGRAGDEKTINSLERI